MIILGNKLWIWSPALGKAGEAFVHHLWKICQIFISCVWHFGRGLFRQYIIMCPPCAAVIVPPGLWVQSAITGEKFPNPLCPLPQQTPFCPGLLVSSLHFCVLHAWRDKRVQGAMQTSVPQTGCKCFPVIWLLIHLILTEAFLYCSTHTDSPTARQYIHIFWQRVQFSEEHNAYVWIHPWCLSCKIANSIAVSTIC